MIHIYINVVGKSDWLFGGISEDDYESLISGQSHMLRFYSQEEYWDGDSDEIRMRISDTYDYLNPHNIVRFRSGQL